MHDTKEAAKSFLSMVIIANLNNFGGGVLGLPTRRRRRCERLYEAAAMANAAAFLSVQSGTKPGIRGNFG
jgi:hypothetical protein